jgi:tetratricopeptide (TPR) repeat protein
MASAPVDWLERGHDHRRARRWVDAMLAYQRAAKAAPSAWETHFHLGAALRELGLRDDGIRAFHDALGVAPSEREPLLAIAEALLDADDATGAIGAAARALRADETSVRAELLRCVAAWRGGANAGDQCASIVAALERDPRLLSAPIAGAIARCVDGSSPSECAPLLDWLVRRDELLPALPASLLAAVVERSMMLPSDSTATRVFEIASARTYVAADHDALRRIAAAAIGVPVAAGLKGRYGALCAKAFVPAVPLLWPRRTGGERLRIAVLLDNCIDASVAEAIDALAALPPAAFEITWLGWESSAGPVTRASTPIPASRHLSLPVHAAQAARRVAALDADVIVDLVGLAGAAGPLLGTRPARAAVTLSTLRAFGPAALYDRTFASIALLVAHCESLRASLASSAHAAVDAAAMAATWDAAVRAQQRGDRAEARLAYDRVLGLQPSFAPAYFLRGALSRQENDLRASRVDFEAALELAPGYVEARVAAANAALADRDPEKAAWLTASRDGFEETVPLLRVSGRAELAMRHGAAAASRFERALALDPIDGDTHYNHGVALQMQGDFQGAARPISGRSRSRLTSRLPTSISAFCSSSKVTSTLLWLPIKPCSPRTRSTLLRIAILAKRCSRPAAVTRRSRTSGGSRPTVRTRSRSPFRRSRCCSIMASSSNSTRISKACVHSAIAPRTTPSLATASSNCCIYCCSSTSIRRLATATRSSTTRSCANTPARRWHHVASVAPGRSAWVSCRPICAAT